MIDFDTRAPGIALVLPGEHGPLHGSLCILPDSSGLVVLLHAALSLDRRDSLMAGIFHQAGLSTLSIDLLSRTEEHFPDILHNVPLLAGRLLLFLGQIRHRMLMGEIREQPLGLSATNVTSPVAIRIAAQRDHDIAAIVCRGGLIDLAGVLYLHSLESPLLLLHEASDTQHIAGNRRALQEIRCRSEIRIIPDFGFDYATSLAFEMAADASAQWFVDGFKNSRIPPEEPDQ